MFVYVYVTVRIPYCHFFTVTHVYVATFSRFVLVYFVHTVKIPPQGQVKSIVPPLKSNVIFPFLVHCM